MSYETVLEKVKTVPESCLVLMRFRDSLIMLFIVTMKNTVISQN